MNEVVASPIENEGLPTEIVKIPHISHRRALWPVRVPAVLTGIMGLINLWSTVTPGLEERLYILRGLLPLEVRRGSHLTAVIAGFALLLLSFNLWRRKQVAWGLTLGVLLLSFFAHIFKGLDVEEAACSLGLALWLWRTRRHFHARSDAPSMRQGLRVLAISLLFTLAYGTLGFYLLDKHFSVNFSLSAAMMQTLTMFTQFYDPGLEPVTRFGRHFATSIYVVAILTNGYAVWMLARPVVWRQKATPEDHEKACAIAEAHGRTALVFCALLPDKTYWFSPGGSFVAYAIVGRIAIALGDPIGPREDAVPAIRGFVEFCERNDWRPAFYAVYDEYLNDYRAAGLETLRIAHEAVVNAQQFTTAGKDFKNIRNSINALTKAGYRTQVHEPPLSDALLTELREVSDDWLAMMHGSEKEFSLGWFEDDYIRACPILAIHNAENDITAFANIVSCYNLSEGTIDLMRRRPDTAKGSMELLFVALFEWAKTQGLQDFNLGASPFAMVGEHSDDPATEKAMHLIYEHVNQFYNFKGLHAFKEKFNPRWRPIFLAYSGKAGLPAVAVAVVRADSGQDSWWDFLKQLRGDHSGGVTAKQVTQAIKEPDAQVPL